MVEKISTKILISHQMTEQYRTISPEIQGFYQTGGHFTGLVRRYFVFTGVEAWSDKILVNQHIFL
jgi:hypothetical protein